MLFRCVRHVNKPSKSAFLACGYNNRSVGSCFDVQKGLGTRVGRVHWSQRKRSSDVRVCCVCLASVLVRFWARLIQYLRVHTA